MSIVRIVIFGVGSPLAIDLEESCGRLGIEIIAAIRNVPGVSFVSDKQRVVEIDSLDSALMAIPFALPMFTPNHRRTALADALTRGFTQGATIIDPTSVVASSTILGEGSYINAGCTIGGAGKLGKFVLINRAVSIGHHASLDDFVSIGPGAVLSGFVHLGSGAVIGAGSVLLPKIEIGENTVVGAGSVVTKSMPENCFVLGSPARVVKMGVTTHAVSSV
jgi:sugar O-acyltransferase (sialic acid O-acetyltransferase NeuD family)